MEQRVLITACGSGIGLSFGGVMGVVPSIAAEQFGTKYYGVNYGILFSGYSIAAFFGPAIAASIAESNDGDFSRAFYIAIAISMIGAAMSVAFKLITRKRRAQGWSGRAGHLSQS